MPNVKLKYIDAYLSIYNQCGKNQTTMADELGSSQASVSNWLAGKYHMSVVTAITASSKYGIPLSDLNPAFANVS